jgi:hypothetical protein
MKAIPDVDNDLSHKHAKYQFQLFYNFFEMGAKNPNLCINCFVVLATQNDKCVDLSMQIFCHFCVANNIKNFKLKIFMLVGYVIYVKTSLSYFLKLVKSIFVIFFIKTRALVPKS